MSYTAEQNVIGSILLRNECLSEIEFLRPEMFTVEKYGKMFYVCKTLIDKGQAVDIQTLVEKIADEIYTYELVLNDIKECLSNSYEERD